MLNIIIKNKDSTSHLSEKLKFKIKLRIPTVGEDAEILELIYSCDAKWYIK